MDVVQSLIAGGNWQVLKEPRGFMKVLQFLFTICAFATTTSFSSKFGFTVKCPKDGTLENSTVLGVVEYDFRMDHSAQTVNVCGKEEPLYVFGDVSSDAQFFVAIGVLSWLFVIAVTALYTVFSPLYNSNPLLPVIDCGVHCVLSILYLAASSAWANSLRVLKNATTIEALRQDNPSFCDGARCTQKFSPDYSKLDISILLGFLNMFLFASNIWFLYKETTFFTNRQQTNQQTPQQGVPGPSVAGGASPYEAPPSNAFP